MTVAISCLHVLSAVVIIESCRSRRELKVHRVSLFLSDSMSPFHCYTVLIIVFYDAAAGAEERLLGDNMLS